MGPERHDSFYDLMATWRPISADHIAPVVLMADPRIAKLIAPERAREILTMRRG
ncbi:hypothetical protein ACIBQX_40700 [Nonomuraea sp. NPDC049714]|uniref:hypothetical protein n=1 Tax=Nonomuraea sp. NPDC049714 TaxID=3364357 RepID=UPI00379A442C